MNYALVFTGTSNKVDVSSLTGGGAVGLVCEFDMELDNYTTCFLFGKDLVSGEHAIRITSATSVTIRLAALSNRVVTLAAGSIPLATRLNFKLYKTATPSYEIRIDDVVKGSIAISAPEVTTPFVIGHIGASTSPTARFAGKMYRANLFGNEFLNTDEPTATTWGVGTLSGFGASPWLAYGGGTAPTGVVTLGTPTGITSSSAAIPYSYSASDQTGFEYRVNGGSAVTVTTSPLVVTGLTASTPYTVEMRAVNASGPGAWSDPANFTTSAAAAAIAFTGTIPAQVFTNGQSVSVDLATYFTGALTPFTFERTGSALAGTGLSISSAGALNGTATTGSVTGVTVTGTDTASNTAVSNAFNVTVNAASTPVSFGGTIPAITGTQNAAITPVNTSTYFTGSLTPFTYSLFSGTLPTGVTLNSSTGVISGTPTVSFSGNIVVRATDSGSNTANSNSVAVTIAAAVGTITITDIANNTDTPWISSAVDAATVMPISLGSVVVNKTGLSTTAGADLVISDAAITTGTEYIIILKIGTAYGWYRAVAT